MEIASSFTLAYSIVSASMVTGHRSEAEDRFRLECYKVFQEPVDKSVGLARVLIGSCDKEQQGSVTSQGSVGSDVAQLPGRQHNRQDIWTGLKAETKVIHKHGPWDRDVMI